MWYQTDSLLAKYLNWNENVIKVSLKYRWLRKNIKLKANFESNLNRTQSNKFNFVTANRTRTYSNFSKIFVCFFFNCLKYASVEPKNNKYNLYKISNNMPTIIAYCGWNCLIIMIFITKKIIQFDLKFVPIEPNRTY